MSVYRHTLSKARCVDINICLLVFVSTENVVAESVVVIKKLLQLHVRAADCTTCIHHNHVTSVM